MVLEQVKKNAKKPETFSPKIIKNKAKSFGNIQNEQNLFALSITEHR